MMSFYAAFAREKCNGCGLCFHECPVMQLPLHEAREEVARLLAGQDTKKVLAQCESCFTCNYICPENAHPAELILSRWREEYEKRGLPARASYFMPTHAPNFRTFVIDRLPEDEKSMLRDWLSESPAEEIFYPGCNLITAPYLARTMLLDAYDIRGSLAMCCGEMYFRMGLEEQLKKLASRLTAWLDRMGTKRMVIPCTAGYNLFTNILPEFGFDRKLEIEHLLPLLLRRIDKGEIKIRRKLGWTVTVQDSCHAKSFGPEFMELPRELLGKLGCKVVEQRYNKVSMLCCGIGGGFSHASSYHPLRLTRSTWRNLAGARQTGADAVVSYCAGCLQMLSTGKLTNPLNRMPVYHIIELLKLAIGEETISSFGKARRAAHFMAGVTRHQAPAMLTPKRIRIEESTEVDEEMNY